MSINVTVHGNPISIKKGRMVALDTDKEFKRRRRIRLQQVRQQSKEIAEDVRNRVREEKNRQLSKANDKNKKKTSDWQSQKLSSLRQQYTDSLEKFGSAHKNAVEESDDEIKLTKIANENKCIADNRSYEANKKRKIEKKLQEEEIEKPIRQKKAVRLLEDTRSKMVAELQSSKAKLDRKRKHIAGNINISGEIVNSSSDAGSEDECLCSDDDNYLPEENKESALFTSDVDSNESYHPVSPVKGKNSINKQKTGKVKFKQTDHFGSKISNESHGSKRDKSRPQTYVSKENEDHESLLPQNPYEMEDEELQQRIQQILDSHRQSTCPTDTRVSDRIKNRQTQLKMDNHLICDISSSQDNMRPPCTSNCNLPYVSKVTLSESTDKSQCASVQAKGANYYDRFNQYSRVLHPQNLVHKVSEESIHAGPSSDRSEVEFSETVQRRDAEAQRRGVKAMEKNRIKKNYEQLMKELPILQRQERLATISQHRATHHMDDERLHEVERRRQNNMESMFETRHRASATGLDKRIITCRPIEKTEFPAHLKDRFQILDITESPTQLNMGELVQPVQNDQQNKSPRADKTVKPGGTVINKQQELQTQEEDLKQKQRTLEDLLQRVNEQRDLLLSEVSSLPTTSNLQSVLQEKIVIPCPIQSTGSKMSVDKCLCEPKTTQKSENLQRKKKESSIKRINTSNSSSDVEIKQRKNKKIKIKTQKVFIKNQETQTSPKLQSKSETSKKKVDKNTVVQVKSADQNDHSKKDNETKDNSINNSSDSDKLCEIVIKMNNDSNVKILQQKSAQPQLQKADMGSPRSKSGHSSKQDVLQDKKSKLDKKLVLKIKTPEKKLCQPANEISTSTSYMSPPEFKKADFHDNLNNRRNVDVKYKDDLIHRSKQTNIDNAHSGRVESKELNPRIIKYIQKLLNMSKKTITEMEITSVSEVSTPGTDVVEDPKNMPFVQLKNVMRHYNLNFSDIKKYLDVSDASSSNVLSSHSLDEFDNSKKKFTPEIIPKISISSQTESRKSDKSTGTNANVDKVLQESLGINMNSFAELSYPNMVLKYTELAEHCCQRITSLADMIERVRQEKQRLLSPEPSETIDNSTSYKELPKSSKKKEAGKHSELDSIQPKNDDNSSESFSQDAIDKYLLEIDPNQINKVSKTIPSNDSDSKKNHNINLNISVRTETVKSPEPTDKENEEFVPLLQGIPKYNGQPQMMPQYSQPGPSFDRNTKPRPPPSLMRNVRHNINVTPHELSTIVEVETMVSSRNVSEMVSQKISSPRDKTSKENSANSSPTLALANSSNDFITLSPENDASNPNKVDTSTEVERMVLVKQKNKSVIINDSENSINLRGRPTKQISQTSQTSDVQRVSSDTTTDKSTSSEDMESILRTLGLGWAVATLKKTQEALALSSSSSSIDLNIKQSSAVRAESDVSLKEILKKQFLKKVSNSGSSSDHTSTHLFSLDSLSDLSHYVELQNISEISGASEAQNQEKSQKRTSTPVEDVAVNKSPSHSNDMFESNTDLSSVKLNSDDNLQLSVPDVKLSISSSRNKRK